LSERSVGLKEIRMSPRIPSKYCRAAVAFTSGALAGAVHVGEPARGAQSSPESGPFAALYGTWAGAGVIKKSNGTNERIRCRSTDERAGRSSLRLRLRCASETHHSEPTMMGFVVKSDIRPMFRHSTHPTR
jgi:hypothetical protein